jgi:hypothetical protein
MLLWTELLHSVPLPTASLFPKKRDIANGSCYKLRIVGIIFAFRLNKKDRTDKAKLRVIGGRKATGPRDLLLQIPWIARLPKSRHKDRVTAAPSIGNPVFHFNYSELIIVNGNPAMAEILMWHIILHLKPIFSDTEQRYEADSRQ